MQRRLGVDVLVSGHTHQLQVGQNDMVHPPSSVMQNSHCKVVSSAIIICIGEVATMTAAVSIMNRGCSACLTMLYTKWRHMTRVFLHMRQTMKHEDSYFINPGSATGAYSTTTPDAQPSFVLMDIDGSRVR